MITTGSVVASADVKMAIGTTGSTVTAGQTLYRSTADQKWYRSLANDVATGRCDGIALSAGVTNRPFVVALVEFGGSIDLGATLSVGKIYCVSPSGAGGIQPVDDVVIDQYMTVIGVATAANSLLLKVINSSALTGAGVS